MGIAKFEMIGRFTRDPEEKKTQSGLTVARFGLATGDRDKTYFWNLVAFGKTAEFIIKWMKKGTEVRVYGDMKNEKRDDKTYHDYIVDKITFVGSKPKSEATLYVNGEQVFPDTDEESPF